MESDQLTPKKLGQLLQQKRGSMGVRAAAAEIEISPATLSRIENGRIPDLETLKKVCVWLGVEPARYLGTSLGAQTTDRPHVQVVFKKNKAVTPGTSKALGNLIMAAYRQFAEKIKADGHQ
jgi:transcriptional regulator with XRE-family HTH domain